MKKTRLLELKKPQPKLQRHTISRMLPNLATVMATCSGLSAIRFAMLGNYQLAATAVLIAAILDALDGRLARLLGAASDFGAELDSLSDFVSFGVAPAVVMYILALNEWRGAGWCICLFFAVCMSLRLARFNVMSRSPSLPAWSAKFFTGVPAPASAMLGIFPLVLYLATEIDGFKSPYICALFMVVAAILMISRLPTFSFKAIAISSRHVPFVLLGVGLMIASFLNAPWETLSICIFTYIVSIPVAYLSFKKMMMDGKMNPEIPSEKNDHSSQE